jgi:predicted O-methyltransferase YrrM
MTDRAAAVLKEIEALASREFLPIIGHDKGKYLVDALKKVNAKTVLEVGTLVGYSAILTAQFLPPGGMVHTIEIDPSLARLASATSRKQDWEAKSPCIWGMLSMSSPNWILPLICSLSMPPKTNTWSTSYWRRAN